MMPCHQDLPLMTLREKKNNKEYKKNDITDYLKLKATSNNLKIHSDKSLTTQIYFFLTLEWMEIFPNETR